MKPRTLFITLVVATLSTGILTLPFFDRLEWLSVDLLFWLRRHSTFSEKKPESSPTVVIGIDEETYRTPPFRDIPKVMWTKQMAKVLKATLDGGARVVGLDVIFPTSVERYIQGYDKEFRVVLHTGAQAGKIILGKVQHQAKPISPFPGYSFAVGHQKNIRSVNFLSDQDGVIRRIPLLFRSRGKAEESRFDPSMALELAARAVSKRPERGISGKIMLNGYSVPGSEKNAMAINFDDAADAIPTYSLADLHACAEKGNAAYFRRHFQGKVVLVGAVLDVEDRKLTSKRFVTGPEGKNLPPRCQIPVNAKMYDERIVRDTIPGVYVHATAVNNVLRRDALSEFSHTGKFFLSLPLAIFAALLTVLVSPVRSFLGASAGALLWMGIAIGAIRMNWVFPLLDGWAASAMSYVLVLGYRVAFLERVKRGLNRFVPDTVRRLIEENPDVSTLAKRTKNVSVLFLDIEGYTKLTESLPREKLSDLIEHYFSLYLGIIRQCNGDINETAGDGLMVIFQDESPAQHALSAVRAAVAIRETTKKSNQEAQWSETPVEVNVGICSGDCAVGSTVLGGVDGDRWTFTASGLVTNTSARLCAYATHGQIVVGTDTAGHVEKEFQLRNLGAIPLKNIADPVEAWEVVGPKGE